MASKRTTMKTNLNAYQRYRCLCKEKDDNCPVCYFVQYPDFVKNSRCMKCQASRSLWFCLTCAHIGCSNQEKNHVLTHYNETQHAIAVDMRNFEVMDYEGYAMDPKLKDKISRWSYNITYCNCPICRYHQIPKLSRANSCMSCKVSSEHWLCLQCNYIGCGRSENGHALLHYNQTKHNRVMQLISCTIWDYCEKKYVHRLCDDESDCLKGEVIKTEQLEQGIEKRIKRLENEWNNFGNLDETNRQMISIEERLTTLSEEKKLLEAKLFEHDTKLNDLLNQFKDSHHSPDQTDKGPHKMKDPKALTSFDENKRPLLTLSISENLEHTQVIIFFVLLLFIYHFLKLFLQAITGNS